MIWAVAVMIVGVNANTLLTVSQPTSVVVPNDFTLTFSIIPLGIIPNYANILQYTKDNQDGGAQSRVPSIYINPNSLKLTIHFSTTVNSMEGFEVGQLTQNVNTTVKIQAIGKTVSVYYNNSLIRSHTLKGFRYYGPALLYSSSPWQIPANAYVSGIQMLTIASKVVVPKDYRLTFQITPFGRMPDYGSILHYTMDGQNIGPQSRVPGIWFTPGTLKL